MAEEGRKDDAGKLRIELTSLLALAQLADVYTRGAKKYADHNWRKGLKWSRVFGAMLRHSIRWAVGEKIDPQDGQHHLASVLWCAAALLEYEITHPELNDLAIDPRVANEVLRLSGLRLSIKLTNK